jgi:hypothetical protein
MLAYAQTPNSTANADQSWYLGAGDYFSILSFIISAAALVVALLIYFELRKRERAHLVSALRLTHAIIANRREHIRVFVARALDGQDRPGENRLDLVELGRFMRDVHPMLNRDADRIERALDPIRLLISAELNDKLVYITEYFRTLADPSQNLPELLIQDGAVRWFNRQRELMRELVDLMVDIRKEAPEIPAPS